MTCSDLSEVSIRFLNSSPSSPIGTVPSSTNQARRELSVPKGDRARRPATNALDSAHRSFQK